VIQELDAEGKVWELCVVGTGPVGMALALEFDRRGREVLVLEAGDKEMEAGGSEASRARIVDPQRHAPMEIAVVRALGGTSWTWGGRCVAFDPVDWMPRDFVGDARWPISAEEVRPYYKRATEYLLCSSDALTVPYKRELTHGLTLDRVERWARNSRVILEHRERMLRSEHIRLSLNSTVTGLHLNTEGTRAIGLAVATPSGARTVKARQIVLAMGGIETTRLLLHTQRSWPAHFGGVDGPLGRYYMGHISGKIASIQFSTPEAISDLDFKLDESGAYYRRRFVLSSDVQIQNRLLNTAFWPDNPPLYDPAHRSGVLSAVFLALAFPPTGRRLLPEAIRLAHIGPRPYRVPEHLCNAVVGIPRGVADIYRIVNDRFVKKPRKPGFIVPNRGGKYAFHYHAEQVPQRDSRITLDDELDQFGVPRAVIDLRFSDQDVQSVIASHRVLDDALRANGIGRLEYWYPAEELPEKIDAQAADGFHQTGTTRMGRNPTTSVVGPDLRVHGLDNLYVASSSVFPTTGQANSTLLAVALSVRLAERLAA
jgi:choline dehydrogenase-like flavoprotein